MKYFEMIDTPELKYAPRLLDWHIRRKEGNKPEKFILLKPQERIWFTDFILSPTFLVSSEARRVLTLYEEECRYEEVLLFEETSQSAKTYYLPLLYETSQLFMIAKRKDAPPRNSGCRRKDWRVPNITRHIFAVRDADKRRIVISLELAEGLLYRKMSGIGLREVELIYKERDVRTRHGRESAI